MSRAPYTGLLEQWQHLISEEGKFFHVVHKRERGAVEACPVQVQDSLHNNSLISINLDELNCQLGSEANLHRRLGGASQQADTRRDQQPSDSGSC